MSLFGESPWLLHICIFSHFMRFRTKYLWYLIYPGGWYELVTWLVVAIRLKTYYETEKGKLLCAHFKGYQKWWQINMCYLLSRDKRHLIRLRNTAIVSDSKIIELCIISETGQEALADVEVTLDRKLLHSLCNCWSKHRKNKSCSIYSATMLQLVGSNREKTPADEGRS